MSRIAVVDPAVRKQTSEHRFWGPELLRSEPMPRLHAAMLLSGGIAAAQALDVPWGARATQDSKLELPLGPRFLVTRVEIHSPTIARS
jgi:hypothetical protein